ncbi:hypothetical protein KJ591_01150, partial [Patescibacteria group bacterium]|nr:hypothetical protein [Patescibacteria group bacterium]
MAQIDLKNRYFLKCFAFLLIFSAFLMFFKVESAFALNTCDTGWQVNGGTARTVDCSGVCKKVTNQSGYPSTFVPTKTSSEWLEFRIHYPTSHISLPACCECSSGDCCDGCNYRSSSYVCNTWTQYNYQCTGTACGNDAQSQSRTNTQKCTGSSASCTGSITYGTYSSWSTIDDCSLTTEKCTTDNSTYASCYSDASCSVPTTYTLTV